MEMLRYLVGTCFLLTIMTGYFSPNLHAAMPEAWEPRGIGGGGALFAPAFNPRNNDMYVATDMGGVFRSTDLGRSWTMYDTRYVMGDRDYHVHATSDPALLYMGAYRGGQGRRSSDGGATWSESIGEVYSGLHVDYDNPQRLIKSQWQQVLISQDGGRNWSVALSNGDQDNGLHLGGVFFDGDNVFIGCSEGFYVSTDGGHSFAKDARGGVAGGQKILSFAGARQEESTRLMAVTSDQHIQGVNYEERYDFAARDVYVLDWGAGATWRLGNSGVNLDVAEVVMAKNNVSVAYLSANDDGRPAILRTDDGGASWTNVLNLREACDGFNLNIRTGWGGKGSKFPWCWGGPPTGIAVDPLNSDKVAWTDYFWIHMTENGGALWRQAYCAEEDENNPGSPALDAKSYRSVGLENTSAWHLNWTSPEHLFASFTDKSALRSEDGGLRWSLDWSHAGFINSTYYSTLHSDGKLYAATSSVHDMYSHGWCSDDRLNNGAGWILSSTDHGRTWQTVYEAQNPVYWLAADPHNAHRMYASIIHSAEGGIFRTDNLNAGSSSTWTKLANPPRTEGHPSTVYVLNDGAVVCSYSARSLTRHDGDFTASSGVFVLVPGTDVWEDRSHVNMRWWTKDLVIDPHDPDQNTWYAGVWNGYGDSQSGQDRGGLYRTTDRGLNWTRIFDNFRTRSCTVSPENPDEMHVTTENDGLWLTRNARAASPTFSRVESYPFFHPIRVFYNPHETSQVWVVSFGNGMRVSTLAQPSGMDDRLWVIAVYVAYWNRAADFEGLNYWMGLVNQEALSIPEIAENFAISDEAKATYPYFNAPEAATDAERAVFVQAVYQNLLNRSVSAVDEGIVYWVGELREGRTTPGAVIGNIIHAAIQAESTDWLTIWHKVQVAEYFTQRFEAQNRVWQEGGFDLARQALVGVTDDSDTVERGKERVDMLLP